MSVVSIRFRVSRIINQLRCWSSYALSFWGIVHVRHLPTFVSVEPANFCQLRCPECPVGIGGGHPQQGRAELLHPEVWQMLLCEIMPYAHTIQFYFQGEPLLNPDLPKMIHEAHEAGIYTIVSTNAQEITPRLADALVQSGLNRIIISLDGLSPKSYNAYRIGGDFEKVREALRLLHTTKHRLHSRTPVIEWQCLRLRTNEHEWAEIRRVYRQWGADCLTFKTAQLYDYASGNTLMPTNPRYARYFCGKDGQYHLKQTLWRHLWHISVPCYRLWSGGVITTSGEVLPCCYDKGHTYSFGNIHTASLSTLFRSDKADTFRQSVLHNEDITICRNCNR